MFLALWRCSCLLLLRRQCRHMRRRRRARRGNCRCLVISCQGAWRMCSMLCLRLCVHGIQRGRPVLLCGLQSGLGNRLHLRVLSKNCSIGYSENVWNRNRDLHTLLPPTTAPVLISRHIRSPAVMRPKWRPRGFIQM